jgi:diaminopimelate epimerase
MVAVKICFSKMHGAGNDFVMIDDRDGSFPCGARGLISAIADRRTGVGCEGVILVQVSQTADFRMRFFNPDGGEAEMCGNGARCVAAFAHSLGAADRQMRFETMAGIVEAEIVDGATVRISLPPPKVLGDDFVNSGVPHKIVAVDCLESVDVEGEGRALRYAPEFAPEGTNVDFVKYSAPSNAEIRTYERGVEAESGACGTGAVAAAIAGVAGYGMEFPVKVKTLLGYELEVDGERDAGGGFRSVRLTGPVKKVFDGEIDRLD